MGMYTLLLYLNIIKSTFYVLYINSLKVGADSWNASHIQVTQLAVRLHQTTLNERQMVIIPT